MTCSASSWASRVQALGDLLASRRGPTGAVIAIPGQTSECELWLIALLCRKLSQEPTHLGHDHCGRCFTASRRMLRALRSRRVRRGPASNASGTHLAASRAHHLDVPITARRGSQVAIARDALCLALRDARISQASAMMTVHTLNELTKNRV
jgi:bacterioferritin-associated ferredoxin